MKYIFCPVLFIQLCLFWHFDISRKQPNISYLYSGKNLYFFMIFEGNTRLSVKNERKKANIIMLPTKGIFKYFKYCYFTAKSVLMESIFSNSFIGLCYLRRTVDENMGFKPYRYIICGTYLQVSKKQGPILYNNLLYKMGHYFLDTQ